MKKVLLIIALLLFALPSIAQDDRQTVAVPLAVNELGKATLDQYLTPITQKITQILKQTKRFIVVNRSEEEVQAERDFQSNPEFLDRMLAAKKSGNMESVKDILSQNTQYNFITFDTLATGEIIFRGADYILKVELRKLDINRLNNPDGTANGYKTLVGLQLSIIDAASNEVVSAEGFTSTPLKVAMTNPTRSVDESILTMESQIYSYLLASFPVKCRIVKLEDNFAVINAGSTQGVAAADQFSVAKLVNIAGAVIEENIGTMRVKALSGANNAVCTIVTGAPEIKEAFKNATKLQCTLIKSRKK